MKAIRIHDHGGADVLTYEDIPIPEAKAGEALVKIEAIGVNFIDIYHRIGLYPLKTPFTLGVEIAKQFGSEQREGYFLPVIHRNTTIPVSRVERLATLEPNQTSIRVKIYQGEARRVEDNLFLGEFEEGPT